MRPPEALELVRLVRALRVAEPLTPSCLEARQNRLLRTAVARAYDEIPFYRELWDAAGLRPSIVQGVADLPLVPIVTPSLAREAVARGTLRSRDAPDRPPVLHTSGTSGEPLAVECGPADRWLWWAFGMRTAVEHGVRGPAATLRFDPHPALPHPLRRIRATRSARVSTALPDRELLAGFLAAAPDVVAGTPTSLRRLAGAVRTAGVGVHRPRPRVVFAEGEVLDPATREAVTAALGVEPVGVYGLTELGFVGWQCERRAGYHLNLERYVVEVLAEEGPARPGELGRLVVTDLLGRDRPLLRYDTGDLAVAGEPRCPCGRSLPVVASIEGRAADAMSFPDGRVVTTRAVLAALAPVVSPDGVSVRQESPRRIRVRLVDGERRAEVESRLRALVGDVDLLVEPAWRAPARGHKTRLLSSAVGSPAAGAPVTGA